MKDYNVYERITPIYGEPYNQFVGMVEARDEKSALNKAVKKFKIDKGGVPVRHIISENFFVKSLF